MRSMLAVFMLAAGFVSCGANNDHPLDNQPKTDTTKGGPAIDVEPYHNQLTGQEKEEGWELLFDGTTKNGWHVYNNKSDGSAWVVADGTLHLDPKQKKDWQTVGGGDIVSEKEYDNYHLKLEWKLNAAGNSGIILFVKEEPKYEHTWHTGPEMQVLDNAGHPDSKINKHRAGDLYDLISSSPETVRPAGEWNQVEIISKDGKLEFMLNGTKVLSTTMWDDQWKQLIAGSKFKSMPDFGTYKKGRFGLQDHGDPVWYRNIKIKKL
ncbi:DUF1080 domain-containing protein [Pseudoflavitalea sp. G-6-1-2]|uniref:3-keto-disaccharide hydrolase n=1 Tax=Pseudoflavitalea sp. G-6-1-2 TaxID=2728841 RepID=UPI00197E79FA|nr:DUF1080 domain-containing protein [Pseudoflavitalea sp. G-6-1-2]